MLKSIITNLQRAGKLLETSAAISKILSENKTLKVSLQLVIEILKSYLNWDVLVLWIKEEQSENFSFVEIAQVPDLNIELFSEKIRSMIENKNTVCIHPLSLYRPIWIENIEEESAFTRRKEALKCGLHGAFAFPFFQGAKLIGVIELFKRAPFREVVDDLLLNLSTSIGIEIGYFLKRKNEEELRLQLITIFNFSNDGIYTTDNKGIVKSWNPSAERFYGWKAYEIIGSTIKRTYPDERLHEFDEIWEKLFLGKPIENFQTERLHKSGKRIWGNYTYGPIISIFGDVSEGCVLVQDVTEEKNIKENLFLCEEKFNTLTEISEDWVWEIDINGVITFSNQGVFNILEYKPDEIIGKSLFKFLVAEERERIEIKFHENISQKKCWIDETIYFNSKSGSKLSLKIHSIGYRGICRDITEMERNERLKNEFIAIVSHELRTPLTSIYGALSLLISKKFDPKEESELLNTAQRNSIRLTNILNDIIDIEKLQLGKLTLNFEKTNLRELILESVTTSEVLAKKADLKIVIEKPLQDVWVNGDNQRLIQVMINLLSNALKFSPKQGTIFVGMEVTDTNVKISIQDQGKGIPKEFESKIFEKFSQADSSSKRVYQGTGLGLNICKNIIEAHGGKISYKTEVGDGTTFYFELPKWIGI